MFWLPLFCHPCYFRISTLLLTNLILFFLFLSLLRGLYPLIFFLSVTFPLSLPLFCSHGALFYLIMRFSTPTQPVIEFGVSFFPFFHPSSLLSPLSFSFYWYWELSSETHTELYLQHFVTMFLFHFEKLYCWVPKLPRFVLN